MHLEEIVVDDLSEQEQKKLKKDFLRLLNVKNPILKSKSLKELLDVFVKTQSSGIPLTYIDSHEKILEYDILDYFITLQKIAVSSGESLVDTRMFYDSPFRELDTLEHLANNSEDYRLLLKTIAKHKLREANLSTKKRYNI
jgi:hypothetical protein